MTKDGITPMSADAHRAALRTVTKDELVEYILALSEFKRDTTAEVALQENHRG